MNEEWNGPIPEFYINNNRILDENDQELDINSIDLNVGKLIDDVILISDIPYISPIDPIERFELTRFWFNDGTFMDIEDMYNDPHVKIIDEANNIFEYIDQGEENQWSPGNYESELIIEDEGRGEQTPERVYENIRRYIPFTPEEQEAFDAYMIKESNKQILLDTGLERLMNTENNIDDMMLLLAEMIGV